MTPLNLVSYECLQSICSLDLKHDLIIIWWSNVKSHSDLMSLTNKIS